MSKKFGVIYVLYYPNQYQVKEILKTTKFNGSVCVVDNTPVNNNNSNYFDNYPDVKYIDNKNSGGIAGAFNLGFQYFISISCNMVFTFDQDSIIPDRYFSEMLNYYDKYNAKILCPNFYDTNSNTFGKFVKLTKFGYAESNDNTTHFCISSGMLIDIATYIELGGFDEGLIIDHVDTDFALKALCENVKIYFCKEVIMEHQIGNRSKHEFLGVTLKPNHHNKLRKYYIVRNGTYLSFKYFSKYKGYFFLNVNRVIHEFLCVILYEKDKLAKVFYMAKAILASIQLFIRKK
ncbi:glycosyltransferase [Vibrio hibernica]|uniref:glycosyltransferase n=1 Tax=Vibrio hibernica TaxID=2587465 RepID=UPI001882B351|nr:glycosyltransferase [Vibrio hibernica]